MTFEIAAHGGSSCAMMAALVKTPTDVRKLVFACALGGLLGGQLAWQYGTASRDIAPGSQSQRPNAAQALPKLSPENSSKASASPPLHLPGALPQQAPHASQPQSASSITSAPNDLALATMAWSAPENVPEAEAHCKSGDALACLALADVAPSKNSLSNEPNTRRTLIERAMALLVLRCRQRDPDSCVAIARMHHLGMVPNAHPAEKSALLTRAKELCHLRPGRTCAALNR